MSKKILVLGLGQNNFLSYLYSTLKKHNSSLSFTVPFFKDLNTDHKDESWMYDNEGVKIKKNILSIIQSAGYCLFTKHFFQVFFFILFIEGKFKKAVHFAYHYILAKAFFITNGNFNDHDIFHFHFMQYSYLRELFLVPKGKKIVCSFWGSDLLRTSDLLNFYIVKKALNKATIITCQSAELREIILSKFGRNLYDKITVTMFPVDKITYEQMDLLYNDKQKIDAFKKEFDYSLTKINVLVGHNGSKFNNHIKIIEQLQKSSVFSKIHIIINFNYGINYKEKELYKKEINNMFINNQNKPTIIEHFFNKEQLALSRLATEVFIHAPISDALSGSMLEMLYASSIVVTGSWLPYKTFYNTKLKYHEVSDFYLLKNKIEEIIANFDTEKQKINNNKKIIKDIFLTDFIVQKWDEILN